LKPRDIQTVTKQSDDTKICAIDVGVKSFLTVYNQIECFELDIKCKIEKHEAIIDEINSKLSRKCFVGKRRHRLKKNKQKHHRKMTNKIRDLHCQSAKMLCESNDVILLSALKVQKLDDNLSNKVNRKMYSLSHHMFRRRLIEKAEQHSVHVFVVSEHFTSKTCTWCGTQNEKLGSKKHFHCDACGLDIDRDYNGARNILLRFLTKFV